jgi:hypothetical protein
VEEFVTVEAEPTIPKTMKFFGAMQDASKSRFDVNSMTKDELINNYDQLTAHIASGNGTHAKKHLLQIYRNEILKRMS